MNSTPYTILGNSAAAPGGVEGIRQTDPDGRITLIAREPHHAYSRPLITYLLGGKVKAGRLDYRDRDYYARQKIDALLGVEVVGLDVGARHLLTRDGRRLPFERLLIAVGGAPIRPRDVAGLDLEGVFTLTTRDDAERIGAFIDARGVRRALVVGGGLIGLKSVEALVARGLQVTLVELADRILSVTFDRAASDIAQKALERAGVAVRCGVTLARLEGESGRVRTAVLRDGARFPCDLVVLAIGVAPNLDCLGGAPLETDRGLLVDDRMQTSASGIYAAGDVAQARDLLTGARRPVPILPVAVRQGVVAGVNMAGGDRLYEGGLAMNAIDVLGLPTISVGRTEPDGPDCEVLAARDESSGSYRKIVLKDNRIIGVIFIGRIDRAGIFTGLIRERIDVSPFKHLLLTDGFGLLTLPSEYRKHMVSGVRVAV